MSWSLVENVPVVLEKKALKSFQYWIILSILQLSPLWEGCDPSFEKKIESYSPKDALCQVWLKMAQWFWRRRFLNFVNLFSPFHDYLHLENGVALHFKKNFKSYSPKDALCQVWLKLAQWFWRRSFSFNFVNVCLLHKLLAQLS